MIDLNAIEARANAATTVVFLGVPMRKENLEFFEHAKGDVDALLAEVERLNAENEAMQSIARHAEELDAQLASVTAERDAARERLCYTCNNGNHSAREKHSTSCDICPWCGQKEEVDD